MAPHPDVGEGAGPLAARCKRAFLWVFSKLMLDPASLRSAGAHWLRGEPRQCGDRAHRLVAPSMAPTGERRPSMACLRPIPAPPRLSPPVCPWLRRCRPTRFDGNGWCRRWASRAPLKRGSPRREGRRCKGSRLPRVGAGTATTRQTGPLAAAAPARKALQQPNGCSRKASAPDLQRQTHVPQLGEEPFLWARVSPGLPTVGSGHSPP